MLRLTAVTVVLLLAGAGAARADDCDHEGPEGSTRAPVAAGGTVLASAFQDDDGEADVFMLGGRSVHFGGAFSPSLTRSSQVVMWRRGVIVAGDRVLVGDVAFPGYRGVAAAESPDGTITLLYGADGTAVLRRIAPDGTAVPAIPVAPAPPMTDVDDPYVFSPQLAADSTGTVFGVVPGERGGVALRWPPGADPQLVQSRALALPAAERTPVVPDEHGGAWLRLAGERLSILHFDAEGAVVTHIVNSAEFSADPVADAHGNALLAWSDSHNTYIARITPAGVRDRRTKLATTDVEALALDPRSGAPWVLAHAGDTLVLQGPRRTLGLARRHGYLESGGSLAIDGHGRAWAVWDESSDRLDSECHEFPVDEHVRWAAFDLNDRRVTSHVLRGGIPTT